MRAVDLKVTRKESASKHLNPRGVGARYRRGMSGYQKPKSQLHKEFLYLDHDTIINSLSAFEAGKVDEIIEKVTEAREGGFEGSVGYSAIKAGGSKKKSTNVEEQLRRSRTNFSAFEGWSSHLEKEGAFGELSDWNLETREEISVGDTIRFKASVHLAPIQQLFLTFINFADQAADPNSIFKQPTAKLAETKKQARMMAGWLRGRDEGKSILVSIEPLGIPAPRVAARLDEQYLVGGTEFVDGEFTIIGQVESLIGKSEVVPAIRVLREVPPTPLETQMMADGLKELVAPAAGLGLVISEDDLSLTYPGVVLHPIAIYR